MEEEKKDEFKPKYDDAFVQYQYDRIERDRKQQEEIEYYKKVARETEDRLRKVEDDLAEERRSSLNIDNLFTEEYKNNINLTNNLDLAEKQIKEAQKKAGGIVGLGNIIFGRN